MDISAKTIFFAGLQGSLLLMLIFQRELLADNSYLRTLLAKAKDQTDEFISYAQKTFEQAQLSGAQSLSLDVALLLCREPDTQLNYQFYAQYIKENAPDNWRNDNQMKLAALNL